MGKILITGGAGFIGSHFREMFPEADFIVSDINSTKLDASNPMHFIADIRDENAMRKIFESFPIDAIIHLAAAHKDFGIEQDEYFSTNVDGAKVLCKLATAFNVRKIVFYSSVAIYGERDTPTDDHTPPQPTNDYGKSKLMAEDVLNNWYNQNENRTLIIVRPALVYGERNVANMYRLIDHIKKGLYFNIGEGNNIKSIAYVKNLVAATWYLLNSLDAGKYWFNYSDKPHLTTGEIGNYVAELLGKPKPKSISLNMLLLLAKPFDFLGMVSGKDLPISSHRVRKYASQTYHQADKIFKLGFTPEYSSRDGLKCMVEWYKDNKEEKQRV